MSHTVSPKLPVRWWSHPAGQAVAAALLSASVFALTWSLATQARADEPDPVLPDLRDTYLPPVPADDGLFRALGGQAGIEALVSVFHSRLLADRRVAPFFEGADARPFQEVTEVPQPWSSPASMAARAAARATTAACTVAWTSAAPTSMPWWRSCSTAWTCKACLLVCKVVCWPCWGPCTATLMSKCRTKFPTSGF
ncbi:MAG: hypothetical protein U5L74_13155 [Ideonella sp.]|nr:hypothetical protein [Ideonella sp.]